MSDIPLLRSITPPPHVQTNHNGTDQTRNKSTWQRVKSSVLRTLGLSKEEDQVAAPVPPSGYLTLIPLSDARLQPRNTRKTAFFLLIFALCIATAVFIAVPRSISIGDIHMEADTLTWNTSKVLYELRLTTSIPIYNPNYLSASVHGDLKIRFYDSEAGTTKIKPTVFPARSMPGMLDVNIDASGVPADYILSIVSQCSTFPHVLIFFLEEKQKQGRVPDRIDNEKGYYTVPLLKTPALEDRVRLIIP